MMFEVLENIVIIILFVLLAVAFAIGVWSMCKVASEADKVTEEWQRKEDGVQHEGD